MAQPNGSRPPQPAPSKVHDSRKRKDHPTSHSRTDNKRPKSDHRAKQRDARTLATQSSSKALKNGQLDVDKFVKAREYEIRALEEGMARSKKALTKRAFQQVPKDLRRRTASHNAKRVPKRLQPRAKREMIEDNTPTVTARRRKPTRHMRLRLETAKKLRAFGALRKRNQEGIWGDKVKSGENEQNEVVQKQKGITTRAPKVKSASLAAPPLPKAKFRKRQKTKTWLPTHLFHAKRARMTSPKEPLWRFAIPLTPTAKCYRPAHRAANERGAIAWDMSYISTIGLEGQQRSLENVLKALGIGIRSGKGLFGSGGEKWRNGTRAWSGFMFRQEAPHDSIAPVTILWCAPPLKERPNNDPCRIKRQVMIRVHPSAFWLVWEELARVSKAANPRVSIEDLRFEVGSVEITGPNAFEVLQGTLWPTPEAQGEIHSSAGTLWGSLAVLEDSAMLPSSAVIGLQVQDPRLHHPPQTVKAHNPSTDQSRLLDILATWPFDTKQEPYALFDRRLRRSACAALPSQKAINRRKALAAPGQYPEPTSKDPKIPALIYSERRSNSRQTTFTVLMPWKCVQPCWYGMMYYPLSVGGQPRFGGMDEKRQLAFECGQPWFPGDFPGTEAGWTYELNAREKREEAWKRRPKSKRVNWNQVCLGNGKKGELGRGWACDWERLLSGPRAETVQGNQSLEHPTNDRLKDKSDETSWPAQVVPSRGCPGLVHVTAEHANEVVRNKPDCDSFSSRSLVTVRIDLLNRGVPQTCARIYRLPPHATSSDLRKRWLDLHPRNHVQQQKGHKSALPRLSKDVPDHVRTQRLAQSLIDPPRANDGDYPPCPGEEDLIGFITTGNYNLGEGQGSGVGNILLDRVLKDIELDPHNGRLCIVRNAGNGLGRLAQWEIV